MAASFLVALTPQRSEQLPRKGGSAPFRTLPWGDFRGDGAAL